MPFVDRLCEMVRTIIIYHECEGRIEKSVLVILNGDSKGRIFLSYPHTNNGFFFLLTTVFLFKNNLPEVPEYAKIQFHMMTSF